MRRVTTPRLVKVPEVLPKECESVQDFSSFSAVENDGVASTRSTARNGSDAMVKLETLMVDGLVYCGSEIAVVLLMRLVLAMKNKNRMPGRKTECDICKCNFRQKHDFQGVGVGWSGRRFKTTQRRLM